MLHGLDWPPLLLLPAAMPVLPTSIHPVPWDFLFPARMAEKCIAEITVRLSDTLKRDLQDLAMEKDRKLSDMIRILLEVSLYGLKHRRDEACGLVDSCGASRGNE